MSELPTLERRISALLQNTAEEIRPCKACGEQLAFVRHKNGKLAPYTLEGVNHFATCPKADQFRRQKVGGNG